MINSIAHWDHWETTLAIRIDSRKITNWWSCLKQNRIKTQNTGQGRSKQSFLPKTHFSPRFFVEIQGDP